MKKTIITTLICVAVGFTLLSFQNKVDHKAATVNQAQGFLIFMQCSPTSDYEVLGTVKKTGLTWTGKPEEMFNTLLRRARKDYPQAEGVIFDDVAMEHATCIKFK
jgi:hypothetical protein